MEHAVESMRFKNKAFDGKREKAVYFSKRVNECNAPNGDFLLQIIQSSLIMRWSLWLLSVKIVVILHKNCFKFHDLLQVF